MMAPLDLERCRRAMRQLDITGAPRPAVIEEAIAAIQRDPTGALQACYYGVKNYASFGDQREDHEYEYGPKHGTIVFRIGRTENARKPKVALHTPDVVYYLEAYRDFKPVADPRAPSDSRCVRYPLPLSQAIYVHDTLAEQVQALHAVLTTTLVDSHVAGGA